MPEELEKILKQKALDKFGTSESLVAKRFIYGTMRKAGWKPERERNDD